MQFYTQIRLSSLNRLFISITRMNLMKTCSWIYRKHSETNPYYNMNKTSHAIREKVMGALGKEEAIVICANAMKWPSCTSGRFA